MKVKEHFYFFLVNYINYSFVTCLLTPLFTFEQQLRYSMLPLLRIFFTSCHNCFRYSIVSNQKSSSMNMFVFLNFFLFFKTNYFSLKESMLHIVLGFLLLFIIFNTVCPFDTDFEKLVQPFSSHSSQV